MHLSQVDFNSLFFGVPDSQLGKLRRVQNACARLVCISPRFSHCTPLLSELHWLPIKQRIIFKTLLITYKAIHGKAAVYIQELLEIIISNILPPPKFSRSYIVEIPFRKLPLGAFMYAAPKLWNNLPLFVRKLATVNEFKTRLKTHLLVNAM